MLAASKRKGSGAGGVDGVGDQGESRSRECALYRGGMLWFAVVRYYGAEFDGIGFIVKEKRAYRC